MTEAIECLPRKHEAHSTPKIKEKIFVLSTGINEHKGISLIPNGEPIHQTF
jgi:hypothetical protein